MADPVFLITGASTGIGAATARRAAEAGYRARARRTLRGQARRRWPTSSAAPSARSPSAATSPSGTTSRRWCERALEAFGRIDVVFANAGFGAARGFLAETPEHWRSMVLTNVYGAALTIRATMDRAEGDPRATCC